MGEVIYKPLIQDMTWSYSRLKAFDDCPYRWYLQYIRARKSDERFYASFGTFMHKILERYYKGELSKEDMLVEYYRNFQYEVHGYRPKPATLQKYIESGADYLTSFEPLPWNTVGVEMRVSFSIEDKPFVGWIDHLGELCGDFYLTDNKSADLEPFSGRTKPTLKDKRLAETLRQLYIYSAAVEQTYGKLPTYLCLNCFRTRVFIKVPFDQKEYENAKKWALDTIERIENTEVFPPKQNPFSCFWICGVTKHCKYDIAALEERRRSQNRET